MIEVDRLHKRFGSVTAVADVSFRAPDGAITGLLGANGAGKTTTLRVICGVLQPDGGRVLIDGISPAEDLPRAQRNIGALLDHTGIYPRLTARENLAYYGQLRGIPPAQLDDGIKRLISLLGLTSISDRRTAGFSQGERMKTALGRALVHSPRNLVLDEPTNGLDIIAVRALRTFLQGLRDSGHSIVLSSHSLGEVRALCDKIVIIAHGAIAAQGTPEELCQSTGTASIEEAFVRITC
jgi:sodium transport system ATP-binding protein